MVDINSVSMSYAVGTSAVTVSEMKRSGNSERIRLVITNVSPAAQVISVAVNADPVAGQGLVLSPGGSMAWERQNTPIQQGRVNVVSNGAGGVLAVYEEVLQ